MFSQTMWATHFFNSSSLLTGNLGSNKARIYIPNLSSELQIPTSSYRFDNSIWMDIL